jgi:hypothetical protein
VLLEFVKYEMDHWHEAVAPRETTPLMVSDAWLTRRRPTLVQVARATGSVQFVCEPLPQGRKSTGIVAPFTSSTVPFALRHVPAMQVCPDWQVFPQEPQFVPLVWRFTQLPEQNVVPPVHAVTQVPLLHTCPLPQATPQAPQLAVLVNRLASQPSP